MVEAVGDLNKMILGHLKEMKIEEDLWALFELTTKKATSSKYFEYVWPN